MSAAKKQEIGDKERVFKSKWCSKYLVVPHNLGVGLVCQNAFAVMKEYKVKCQYTTKHFSKLDEIVSHARVEKIQHLKNPSRTARCFCQLHESVRTGYKTEF